LFCFVGEGLQALQDTFKQLEKFTNKNKVTMSQLPSSSMHPETSEKVRCFSMKYDTSVGGDGVGGGVGGHNIN
jgi:hypothetical protein